MATAALNGPTHRELANDTGNELEAAILLLETLTQKRITDREIADPIRKIAKHVKIALIKNDESLRLIEEAKDLKPNRRAEIAEQEAEIIRLSEEVESLKKSVRELQEIVVGRIEPEK